MSPVSASASTELARNHSSSSIAVTAVSISSRIWQSPIWSFEAARDRAKKLRSILDQGEDPARYHKQNNVVPVENIIRYIAEHLQTKP